MPFLYFFQKKPQHPSQQKLKEKNAKKYYFIIPPIKGSVVVSL
jgi:hypothetical protein